MHKYSYKRVAALILLIFSFTFFTVYGYFSSTTGNTQLGKPGDQVSVVGSTCTVNPPSVFKSTMSMNGQRIVNLGNAINPQDAMNKYSVGLATASSVGPYITKSSITATYLQKSSATATYLQKSSATATYLQKSSATAVYAQIVNVLTKSSATATYLQKSSATATYYNKIASDGLYLAKSSATATYLQITPAAATYLTKSSATATYATISTTLTKSSATATYLQLSSATAVYLQKTGKAADAELLDGVSGSDYQRQLTTTTWKSANSNQWNGITFSTTGLTAGDLLRYDGSNIVRIASGTTAGTYLKSNFSWDTPAGAGDTQKAVDEVITGDWHFNNSVTTFTNISASGLVTVSSLTVTNQLDFTQDKFIKPNVGCSVYLSGDQSILNLTVTTILFNTEEYDMGGDFTVASSSFTCPVNGYYLFTCGGLLEATVVGRYMEIAPCVNGVKVRGLMQPPLSGDTGTLGTVTSKILKCVAGDKISAKITHSAGGTKLLYAAYTWMDIWLVGVY